MKHLFIVNPVAGGKKNKSQDTVQYIKAVMSEKSEPYEIYITKAPMDAAEKVRAAAAENEKLRVYACGGDGTLNECLNGAVGRENVSLTHYPCGTGNDFIKIFGADANQFSDLHALVSGIEHPIDLIKCNDRYSINVCSVGIDARIGTDVHRYSALPALGGPTGYVISLIINFIKGINEYYEIRTLNENLSGEFALVCACNGRYYGGGFNPVPDAMPDDGLIDFLIVHRVSLFKAVRVILKYARGHYREMGDIVTHLRGKSLEMVCRKPVVVNVDGEAVYHQQIRFSVDSGKIPFVFPAKMMHNDKITI